MQRKAKTKITLVKNLYALHPVANRQEAFLVGYVVNDDDTVRFSEVLPSDTSVTLLSCGVPQLQSYQLAVNCEILHLNQKKFTGHGVPLTLAFSFFHLVCSNAFGLKVTECIKR